MRRLLPPLKFLLLAEGLAVGTLVHGGIHFMGAHQDAVQRAVVLGIAVIGALLDGAFDALVGMVVHPFSPPSFGLRNYFAHFSKIHSYSCNLVKFVIW